MAIGGWSKLPNDVEQKKDTTHRECLPIVWSVLFLRLYTENIRLTIRRAHAFPKWITNLTDYTGKLESWLCRLSENAFDVVYRAGIKRQAADVLSGLPTTVKDGTQLEEDLLNLTADITQNQKNIY